MEGEPDPSSGMVVDLKDLKSIIEEEVVDPMDHRFLNHEVPPFDRIIPTAENVAMEIWRRLNRRLSGSSAALSKVRLFETGDLYIDVTGEDVRENDRKL